MDPDQVAIIMNECCDEEDEDGCIPYESRFKIEISKRLPIHFNTKSSEFFREESPTHSSCRKIIMHEFLGHSMDNGFIFKK